VRGQQQRALRERIGKLESELGPLAPEAGAKEAE
jgi:hypothetical protein